MAGETTGNNALLIRSELWSSQLKDILEEEMLDAQRYVNWLTEFPDGNTFTIPSIGQFEVDNYVEDTAVNYRSIQKGEFQFTINEYLSAATYITAKDRQDSFYASQLEAAFVPGQARAIAEHVETKVLNLQSAQTANDPNQINGADHRWVGSAANETMSVTDFAYADYALTKANVPQTNRIAIVDPSVAFEIDTITNITNISNNPRWEGIIESGISTGMKFVRNIYGFDVFVSKFLPTSVNETIVSASGSKTTAAGVANLFFSADSSVLPFIGAWRQMPTVDSEWNKDFQREEYVTTARYDCALYRPENLVVVLTDTDQVAP